MRAFFQVTIVLIVASVIGLTFGYLFGLMVDSLLVINEALRNK